MKKLINSEGIFGLMTSQKMANTTLVWDALPRCGSRPTAKR